MVTNIEVLKSKIDIVEVISKYLPLKKSGINYSSCCPFHTEKSGSFIVSPQKQIYHCFGCGASGDAIKFLCEHKKITFNEALEELASQFNVFLEKSQSEKPRYRGYEALKELNDTFKLHLREKKNEKILSWLIKRGLNLEDLETFDIGLAPTFIESEFKKELQELGAMYENKTSPFSNRITFALRNATHQVVAFSSRIHPYRNFKNNAKYLNSKESKVFNKSQTLYNLSRARSEILKQKKVYVLEGFFDCIALSKLGAKNCVATCGTAFNVSHLSAINRLKEEIHIILCFDKDEAGLNAQKRALELLIHQNYFNCSLSFIKGDFKDIGEVLQKGEELKLKNIDGFSYFCLNGIKCANTPKEKNNHIERIKSIITKQNNFYLKEELIKKAVSALNINPSFFTQKIQNKNYSLEESFLKSMFLDSQLANYAYGYLDGDELEGFKEEFESYKEDVLTKKAKDILLDENIVPIPFSKFKIAIKELKKRFYKKQIQIAKVKKDINKLILLTNKLKEIL
ncbi:DNA primase [Helicobacter valdiviensis]|uniref:DNA primase n=1 Tax=Helicobacter valdiviensis TaxID=1458358 RepID=A0A2W6MWW5_9HELI|nr:DNA primase [Helicobacter valdiviensis]PZT47718.1 DNA primase [Helicobacter valdiviensis]